MVYLSGAHRIHLPESCLLGVHNAEPLEEKHCVFITRSVPLGLDMCVLSVVTKATTESLEIY